MPGPLGLSADHSVRLAPALFCPAPAPALAPDVTQGRGPVQRDESGNEVTAC